MTVSELCSTPAITAHPDDTIVEAARRLRKKHVGELVVVDDRRQPVGILSDRDIVVSAVAQSPHCLDALRVADVMTPGLVSVRSNETVEHALRTMASHGIRRLPVTGPDGEVEGILSLDDLLQRGSVQLWNLVTTVAREQRRERDGRKG
jgi:CBS domain-containing protein